MQFDSVQSTKEIEGATLLGTASRVECLGTTMTVSPETTTI